MEDGLKALLRDGFVGVYYWPCRVVTKEDLLALGFRDAPHNAQNAHSLVQSEKITGDVSMKDGATRNV